MALTLASTVAMVAQEDTYRGGIVKLVADANPLLANLPLLTIAGGGYDYTVETAAPTFAGRALYTEYTPSQMVAVKRHASLQIMGSTVTHDRALVTMHGPQIALAQEESQFTALGHRLGSALINGAAAIPDFTPIKNLVTPANTIAAGSTAAGDPMTLRLLARAIEVTRNPNVIAMSHRNLANLSYSAPGQNAVASHLDQFGVMRPHFNGLPIYPLGQDEMGGAILPFTEATPGGGTTGSSIYVLSLGYSGLFGIQSGPPRVFHEGAGQTVSVVHQTSVEWLMNLACVNDRAITRIWGVSDAIAVNA